MRIVVDIIELKSQMFLLIKKVFLKIVNLGNENSLPVSDKKKIRLLNILCLVGLLNASTFLIIGILDFYVSTDGKAMTINEINSFIDIAFADLIMLSIMVVTLFFQYKKKYNRARWIFVIAISIRSVIFVAVINPGGLHEYGLVQIPLMALLFLRRTVVQVVFLVISIAAIFIIVTNVEIYPQGHALDPITLSVFFVAIFITIKYFMQSNEKSEGILLFEKNKVLKDAIVIENQKTELQRLNDLQQHFFINISHELKTPLTLIKGYARKLNNGAEENTKNASEVILNESNNMQQLIDNILDVLRMDDYKFPLDLTELDCSQFLSEIHQEFEPLFNARNLQLNLKIEAPTIMATFNKSFMKRAITNLLTNALKFTSKDGLVELQMKLNENLEIAVYNTGIGIAETDIDKIFERFYRANNSISKSQGSGLGLAITKEIVKVHDFSIKAESRQGSYAKFTIEIPAEAIKIKGTEQPEPKVILEEKVAFTTNKKGIIIPKKRYKILLVEDHENMRNYIGSIIGMGAYDIIEAADGKMAIDLIKSSEVDLVLTDYMMPYVDGYELVKFLKSNNYLQPIIVITAQAAQTNKLSLLRLGIDGYLSKPFQEEELLVLIQNALKFHQERLQYVQEQTSNAGETLPQDELNRFNLELNKVLDQQTINGELSIAVLCDQLHMTERTLFRRVKELTGGTPARLILEARLLKAKRLYEAGSFKSVRQLGFSVGFTNSTRFAQKFQERFGIPLN